MKDINCIVLIGQTLTALKGAEAGRGRVSFETAEGKRYTMWHDQDCCEGVDIHDVKGDPQSLLGSPLKVVDEVISRDWPDDVPTREYVDSATWTTFTFVTERGDTVILRWLGESNGYYSESVSFGEDSRS